MKISSILYQLIEHHRNLIGDEHFAHKAIMNQKTYNAITFECAFEGDLWQAVFDEDAKLISFGGCDVFIDNRLADGQIPVIRNSIELTEEMIKNSMRQFNAMTAAQKAQYN